MATYFMAPAVNYLTKTLSGSVSDVATTITLNNTTNMLAPGYIVVNRTNSSGTATPDNREVIYFTGISGSDLTGCTRAADGSTARTHADASLVETTMTAGAWNSLTTIVSTAIDSNSYLKAIASPVSIARMQIVQEAVTSIASIARVEVGEMVVNSTSSISRVESPFVKASSALVSIATILGHLSASGASVTLPHASVDNRSLTLNPLSVSTFVGNSQATFVTGSVVLSGPTLTFPGPWAAYLTFSGETFGTAASAGNTFFLGLDGADLSVAAYGSVQQEVTANNTLGEAASMSVLLPSLASGTHGFRVTATTSSGIGSLRRASLSVIPWARIA